MIVRMNQFDVARAEQEAGWAPFGLMGPVAYAWPPDARAYEVLVLDRDEQGRALGEEFRRQQVRLLIPQAVVALSEPGEQVVVRLDGPWADDELVPALGYLTESDGSGRFAFSGVQKLEHRPQETIASVRIHPTPQRLAALAGDARLGLDRSVRLRVVAVPNHLVNPLMDVTSAEDERWAEILPQAGFVLGTTRGLRTLHVITGRFDTPTLKSRLTQRLAAAAASTFAASPVR